MDCRLVARLPKAVSALLGGDVVPLDLVEYSEPHIADLLHDRIRLSEWMETVPEFLDYEPGSEQKVRKVPEFGTDDFAPARKLEAGS